MDNEKIIKELCLYYHKILLPYHKKQVKGYTFEIFDRIEASNIFYNNKNNNKQVYATPFYDGYVDGLAIDIINLQEKNDIPSIVIPIKITGNEKKDVKEYFKLCKKYLK